MSSQYGVRSIYSSSSGSGGMDCLGEVTICKPCVIGVSPGWAFFFFFGIHLFNVGQKLVYTDSVVLQRPTKVKSVCLRGKGESIRSP